MLNPRGNHVTLSRGILVDIWSQVNEHSMWSFRRGLHVGFPRGINDLNPRLVHVDISSWNQQSESTLNPRAHFHVKSAI